MKPGSGIGEKVLVSVAQLGLRVWLLIPEGNRALLPCRGSTQFPHFLDAPEEGANQRPDRELPFPAAAGSVLPSSEPGVARPGRGL